MTCLDAWYSMAATFDGMCQPSPPSLAGIAKRVRSKMPGGGLAVNAGIMAEPMISSSNSNIGPIPGMVRHKYLHLLINPCVRAEKAAWGCVEAISARRRKLAAHYVTFACT